MFDCAFKPHHGKRSIQLHGASENDGRRAAVHQRRDFQDRQPARDCHGRGHPEHLRRRLEDGPQCVAIYRDGSKRSAPLNTHKTNDRAAIRADGVGRGRIASELGQRIVELDEEIAKLRVQLGQPLRRRLPDTRTAITHKFDIAGHEGYLTVGLFEDGQPGELFITMAKEGTTIGGLMDTMAR